MIPVENFIAGGFIVIGVFMILCAIGGAVEFHHRGMERVRRGQK